jgi:hypothetical protein
MSKIRLVWFFCVVGQGNAYNGTAASSVYIPSKKEVKVEYDEYEDELAGIQPSKLLVYEDMVALDDRRYLKEGLQYVYLGISWVQKYKKIDHPIFLSQI